MKQGETGINRKTGREKNTQKTEETGWYWNKQGKKQEVTGRNWKKQEETGRNGKKQEETLRNSKKKKNSKKH